MTKTVRVYIADIQPYMDETQFLNALSFVSKQRREAIARFRMQKDKVRSLCCGLLLHFALEEEGITESRTWEIAKADGGKPYFKDHPEICFNMSHSGDYVVVAVSDMPIGVDIQKKEKLVKGMEKQICPERLDAILSMNDEEKETYILNAFSLKEAYMKYTGRGLGLSFQNIQIDEKSEIISQEGGKVPAFYSKIDGIELSDYRLFVCAETKFSVFSKILHQQLIHENYSLEA